MNAPHPQRNGARPPGEPASAVPADMRSAASWEATGDPVGIAVRLPVLRRPPGWSMLDETALRTRAVQLLHAEVAAAPARPESAPDRESHPAPVRPPPLTGMALGDGVPTAPGPAGHAVPAPALSQRDPPRRRPAGPVLVAMMAVMGLMALAPWLIWAPLAGGLALGILLLQTGLLRRWLVVQRAEGPEEPAPDTPGHAAHAGHSVRGVPGVKVPAARFAHAGWLLAAALVLVGVQAAMLITTIQVQRAAAPKPAPGDPPGPQRRVAEAQAEQDRVFGPPLQHPLTPPTLSAPTREARPGDEQRVIR